MAGFALAALTLGWPLAASVAGRIYLRIGFRRTALIGAVGDLDRFWLAGPAVSEQLGVAGGATCFVIGMGMGLVVSPTLISAQSSVEWERRGVVTGTNVFARSMGSALGIAVFGAIANASLSQRVGGTSPPLPARFPSACPRARPAQGLLGRWGGRGAAGSRGVDHAESARRSVVTRRRRNIRRVPRASTTNEAPARRYAPGLGVPASPAAPTIGWNRASSAGP